jgi:hypothetical protein
MELHANGWDSCDDETDGCFLYVDRRDCVNQMMPYRLTGSPVYGSDDHEDQEEEE